MNIILMIDIFFSFFDKCQYVVFHFPPSSQILIFYVIYYEVGCRILENEYICTLKNHYDEKCNKVQVGYF